MLEKVQWLLSSHFVRTGSFSFASLTLDFVVIVVAPIQEPQISHTEPMHHS